MPATLDQDSSLDALVEIERAEARLLGRRIRSLGALAEAASYDEKHTGIEQFTVLELAGSCRIGQQSATARQVDAAHVLEDLPLLLAALEAGEVFVPQARVVISETSCCSAEVCAAVDAAVAERGRDLPPGPLRKLVRKTVQEVEAEDRQAEADRLAEARASRRVWIRPEADGMATIGALVTAEAARAFALGLDKLAREAKDGSDRTMDQCRADVLAELPLRALGQAGGPRIILNVHVPMATVLDRSSTPGHLDGHGPISAEHVRLLLPDAGLRRVLVDVDSGRPLSVDAEVSPASSDAEVTRERLRAMLQPAVISDVEEPQYRPSTGLDRFVRLRDQVCSAPGCSQPASACDLDHLVPYPAGPTAADNLGPESRRCHRAKHHGWTVLRHVDGSVTWISPLGRRYRRPPPWDPPPAVRPESTPPQPHEVVPWEPRPAKAVEEAGSVTKPCALADAPPF